MRNRQRKFLPPRPWCDRILRNLDVFECSQPSVLERLGGDHSLVALITQALVDICERVHWGDRLEWLVITPILQEHGSIPSPSSLPLFAQGKPAPEYQEACVRLRQLAERELAIAEYEEAAALAEQAEVLGMAELHLDRSFSNTKAPKRRKKTASFSKTSQGEYDSIANTSASQPQMNPHRQLAYRWFRALVIYAHHIDGLTSLFSTSVREHSSALAEDLCVWVKRADFTEVKEIAALARLAENNQAFRRPKLVTALLKTPHAGDAKLRDSVVEFMARVTAQLR